METRITTPEILACIDCWIAYNCIHVKNVNKDTPHTGYLRHAFEADMGIHISNEDFALAMYRAGYKCSRDGNHWNISKKCIAGSSITLAPYLKHSKYGHVSEDNIIAAYKRGIRYPFFTGLRRSGTPEFYGYEIDNFEIELDLYGYVPVMVYTLNEGRDLDWMILKNLRENKEEYYLIHPEKYKNPIKIACLGDKWVSNAEYDMSHSRYNNDYFGEFDHDNKYTRLSLDFLERKARAGTPIHAGWFKVIEE